MLCCRCSILLDDIPLVPVSFVKHDALLKHSSLRHVQCAAVALLPVGACWTGQWKVSNMKRDEMDVTRAPFLTEGDNGEGGGTAWGPWLVAFAVRLCRLRNQQGRMWHALRDTSNRQQSPSSVSGLPMPVLLRS